MDDNDLPDDAVEMVRAIRDRHYEEIIVHNDRELKNIDEGRNEWDDD